MYTIRETVNPEDVINVGFYARREDQEYANNMFPNGDIYTALQKSVDSSDKVWCVYDDCQDIPVAIAGLNGQHFWVQTSGLTDGHATKVIRTARSIIKSLPQKQYYVVYRAGDDRVRLLSEACGFTETVEQPNYRNTGIDHVAAWRM